MTSRVHRDFVKEPMGNKSATALPGIGIVAGRNLSAAGYAKASNVFGKFLVLNRDETQFKKWLMSTAGANTGQQNQCYQCLVEYNSKWM
ncbi:barrier-to-autointegration factor-like [Mya arenaria]|uniref:barrier-to-autointegration factor-like n=1 Tax=Mya arenaria TaxID=6604 RepID=UPI0022E5E544|nr:barrier-to-autointegration factor-like [Mya arenaria]XP_052770071.1 barrier-to-autointegration factor-like [Mya arenaria]XP_052770072.1 barrier-to-autointegration factor-like [Mya arenaria]